MTGVNPVIPFFRICARLCIYKLEVYIFGLRLSIDIFFNLPEIFIYFAQIACYYINIVLPYIIMVFDEIDYQLVMLLRKNARLSSNELSKMMDNRISSSAIRRRINTLIDNNVMRFIAFPDWSILGFPVIAIIALEVPRDKSTSMSKTLGEYDNSLWISVTSGRYSIMSIWRFASTEELYKFTENELGKLDGITSSEIFISLYLAKRS